MDSILAAQLEPIRELPQLALDSPEIPSQVAASTKTNPQV
jgi:hypothetical protein